MKSKIASRIMLTLLLIGMLTFAFNILTQAVDATISTWITKASMPTKRGQAVVITGDDGLIYVMGGFDSAEAFNTVEAYDPLTDTWVTKASMPYATRGAAGAKGLNGKIYVIAGTLNYTHVYNPPTDTWTVKASIPLRVWEAGAATGDDGKIYVIGGEWEYGDNPTNRVQVYDPSTDSWTAKTSMSTAREELCVVKGGDGLIYAIGGWNGSAAISTVEAYDPATDTWTAKASLPTPLCQFGATLGPDGKIYVIGGGTSYLNNDPPFYNSVYSYDVYTDTWTTEPSMPTARRELGATTWHGSIYAIGGGNTYHGGPYLDTNEEAVVTPTKPISIYTDRYSYSAGDTMHLGLDIYNPLDRPITVCIAIWLERPVGPIKLILHAHAVTLPASFTYSNPDFETFVLPAIPPGTYTWHAAFLKPTNHQILVEDTAEWEFS